MKIRDILSKQKRERKKKGEGGGGGGTGPLRLKVLVSDINGCSAENMSGSTDRLYTYREVDKCQFY